MVVPGPAGDLRSLDTRIRPRLGPAPRPRRRTPGGGPACAAGLDPVRGVVRERAPLPRLPGRRPPPRHLREPPLHRLRPRLRGRARRLGPGSLGPLLPRGGGRIRRPGHQAPRRVLPLALGDGEPAPHRLAHHPGRGRRVRRSRTGRGPALRRLLLRRARLDLRRPAHRHGGRHVLRRPARPLPRLRRRADAGADPPLPARHPLERHCLARPRRRDPFAGRLLPLHRPARCRQRPSAAVRTALARPAPAGREGAVQLVGPPDGGAGRGLRPAHTARLRLPHPGVRPLRGLRPVRDHPGRRPQLRLQPQLRSGRLHRPRGADLTGP
ncbi:hypothetical protein GA0115255_103604 [Streptomyces sp. Ncost-T6T-2b]|nr:hypothetical protein GA0115255_103604 [Streptomyces sp. Ncost-T6T-2b]